MRPRGPVATRLCRDIISFSNYIVFYTLWILELLNSNVVYFKYHDSEVCSVSKLLLVALRVLMTACGNAGMRVRRWGEGFKRFFYGCQQRTRESEGVLTIGNMKEVWARKTLIQPRINSKLNKFLSPGVCCGLLSKLFSLGAFKTFSARTVKLTTKTIFSWHCRKGFAETFQLTSQ